MRDLRLGDSFSDCCGREEAFCRRGFTMAVLNSLNHNGKRPDIRDELIMCVTVGRSSSKHLWNKEVGLGSGEQVFGADLSITL